MGKKKANGRSVTEFNNLFSQVRRYRNKSEFKEMLQFIKGFPCVGPYNAMLVRIQKPGAKFVTSASAWEETYDRVIKPGARPLLILHPFGPVAFVYDIADTEGGKPVPDWVINPFAVRGNMAENLWDTLRRNLPRIGVKYYEVDHGNQSAGLIRKRKEVATVEVDDNRYGLLYWDLAVNANHAVATKFATIIHELAHLFCGHLGLVPDRAIKSAAFLPMETREFEAESAAWLVCQRQGLDIGSDSYLNNYLDGDGKIPGLNVDAMLKAAGIIEGLLQKPVPWKYVKRKIMLKDPERTTAVLNAPNR